MSLTLASLQPINHSWLFSLVGVSIWLLLALSFIVIIRMNPHRTAPQSLDPTLNKSSASISLLPGLKTSTASPSSSASTTPAATVTRSNTFLNRSNTLQKRVMFISEHIADTEFLHSLVQQRVFSIVRREAEHDDEVALEKGDALVVYYVFSDAWSYGLNERSKESGMFPLCVCLLK